MTLNAKTKDTQFKFPEIHSPMKVVSRLGASNASPFMNPRSTNHSPIVLSNGSGKLSPMSMMSKPNFSLGKKSRRKARRKSIVITSSPDLELFMAAPNEHSMARKLLQSKNLLPYLNKSDCQATKLEHKRRFKMYGHGQRAKV